MTDIHGSSQDNFSCIVPEPNLGIGYAISYHIYHLFSFRRSVQDYKIHMNMEIVTFLGIRRCNQYKSVQQSHGPVQCLRFQHNTNYLV
jgi:hypothetical protein